MVNIIVMVFSPLGDFLCLSNRDTVSVQEDSLGEKKKKKT